ncbi:hypothetical protein U1Q18_016985 [Sarracenia purpurea var. burkii]
MLFTLAPDREEAFKDTISGDRRSRFLEQDEIRRKGFSATSSSARFSTDRSNIEVAVGKEESGEREATFRRFTASAVPAVGVQNRTVPNPEDRNGVFVHEEEEASILCDACMVLCVKPTKKGGEFFWVIFGVKEAQIMERKIMSQIWAIL